MSNFQNCSHCGKYTDEIEQMQTEKKYESDFMQLFSADFTTFLIYLPMKTWKNRVLKLPMIQNLIFLLTALSCPYGLKLKKSTQYKKAAQNALWFTCTLRYKLMRYGVIWPRNEILRPLFLFQLLKLATRRPFLVKILTFWLLIPTIEKSKVF